MIRTIFWIFVLVLALSFFGISIQKIVNSPAGQENFAYLFNLLSQAWDWIKGTFQHLQALRPLSQ